MSDDSSAEKTEPASEKRRQEYRERGEVARSRDVISVLVLFIGIGYFTFFGDALYHGLGEVMSRFFTLRPEIDLLDTNSALALGEESVLAMARMLAPLVGGIVLVSILGNVAQVGFLLSPKAMAPNLDRLNFFTKVISHFFNKQAIGTLIGSLAKMAVVAIVIYVTLNGDGPMIKAISTLTLVDGITFMLGRCISVVFNVSIVLIIIALADYMWNRHVMEEKMKMSKQEVKDEAKDVEGNPQMKGQMRRRAMDMANQRMMQDVPQADVIVNNPTHISIALRYRRGHDGAPVVLAKGADLMALRIRRIAKAHSIPMVENVPLARALYKHVRVGRPVPSRFYRAVAEVLAYVYRLKRRHRPASKRRGTQDQGTGTNR